MISDLYIFFSFSRCVACTAVCGLSCFELFMVVDASVIDGLFETMKNYLVETPVASNGKVQELLPYMLSVTGDKRLWWNASQN